MLPLREIDSAIPIKGKIIDLGCGEGTIASYLAQKKDRFVVGVDIDKKRLQKSKQKNLKFILKDIREFKFKNVRGIILSDILHHLNFHDQNKLLMNISKSLNKGSILVIKEIDTGEFIRSRLSRFWDFVFYPKDKIYFSKASNLKKLLENLNFRVKILRPCRFFPGSTTLFICKK